MVQATQDEAIEWPDNAFRGDPARQAFVLLRIIFTVAPILFGLDKFFNILVHWPIYLYPNALVITEQEAMYVVGIVEIVAGVAVAIVPRYGSLLVVLWLTAIIVNLLAVGSFYDVALRDFGLLVGALALWRLSVVYAPGLPFRRRAKVTAKP